MIQRSLLAKPASLISRRQWKPVVEKRTAVKNGKEGLNAGSKTEAGKVAVPAQLSLP